MDKKKNQLKLSDIALTLKYMLITPPEYSQVTQIKWCLVFLVYVATILKRTRIQNTQFAVYISDTHVTLKQGQDHQTKNANVDPKHGYQRSCFNGAKEKTDFFFQMRKFVNYLLEHV